jgi:hypothetical protein
MYLFGAVLLYVHRCLRLCARDSPVCDHAGCGWGADSTKRVKAKCVHALNGQALPRASHFGEIALADSGRLRSTLAAAPVLFAHAAVGVAKN